MSLLCRPFQAALLVIFGALGQNLQAEGLEELIRVQKQVQSTLEAGMEALVAIESDFSVGSGVLIREDGLILTASHVCGEAGDDLVITLADGSVLAGKTLGSHRLPDLGLVQIEGESGPWQPVEIETERSSTRIGSWVYALGHPWGRDGERGPVLRVGKIVRSGKYRLQSDCELLGGDSGGPLFTPEGKLVGIHSFIGRPLDENFHGGLNLLDRTMDAMLAGEMLRRRREGRGGFLGVETDPEDDRVIVRIVFAGTAAMSAGLKKDDEIVMIDGDPIEGQQFFIDYLRLFEKGETLRFLVRRGEKEFFKDITLGAWEDLKE